MQLLPLGPFLAEILTSSPRASPSPSLPALLMKAQGWRRAPQPPLGERSRAPPAAGCSSLGARGGSGRERSSTGSTFLPGQGGFYLFFPSLQLLIHLNTLYLWPLIPTARHSSARKDLLPCHLHQCALVVSFWSLERWKKLQIVFFSLFFNHIFASYCKA